MSGHLHPEIHPNEAMAAFISVGHGGSIIPDGTVLSVWPLHSDRNCWCKPEVTWIASNTGQQFIYVLHKRLDRGEFDS